MMDLITAGWFEGDKFVRMHSDGTLEVRVAGKAFRAPLHQWIESVPATPHARPLPHERRQQLQREPGED